MKFKSNLVTLLAILSLILTYAPAHASTNQALTGQLIGLANDIKEFLDGDRLLKGRKIRFDKVSSSGMPDTNFDQSIELKLNELLQDRIDPQEKRLILKVELSYLVSETATNLDNRVIQVTAKMLDSGRTVKSFLREVNNTSDINRILSNTVTLPDTKDYKLRLASVESTFEKPSFNLIQNSQIAAPGQESYRVEIRKRSGGQGTLSPVEPFDQQGHAFAPLEVSDTYEIVLYNYDMASDAVARVDIDGLDAITTFCADVDADGKQVVFEGYYIPRATSSGPGVHIVPGWFHTLKPGNDNVFEFVVNELGKGAATALKARGKTGVITVRFFDAYQPNEKPRSRNFGETGKGRPRKQDYDLKNVIIGTEPISQVSVRYSRKPD